MLDPIENPDVVGYVGVAIFDLKFYQGFMVNRLLEKQYRRVLQDAREQMRRMRVLQKFTPPDHVKMPTVVSSVEQMDDGELVAALSASLVHLCIEATKRPGLELQVGSFCGALRLLLQKDYFWIEGKQVQGGMNTTVVPLSGSTPKEAREAFRHQPTIMMIDMMRMLDGSKR